MGSGKYLGSISESCTGGSPNIYIFARNCEYDLQVSPRSLSVSC
jgi:hypothetical protein